jgi:hypothetical protein
MRFDHFNARDVEGIVLDLTLEEFCPITLIDGEAGPDDLPSLAGPKE